MAIFPIDLSLPINVASHLPSASHSPSLAYYDRIRSFLYSEKPNSDEALTAIISQGITDGLIPRDDYSSISDKVAILFNAFIQDSVERKLPESEIYDFRLRMQPTLTTLRIDGLPIDTTTTRKTTIQSVNEEGKITLSSELEIPFAAYKHMDMLRAACEGAFNEEGKVPVLELPYGTNLEDFKQYLKVACMQIPPSEVMPAISAIPLLQICDYLLDVTTQNFVIETIRNEEYTASIEELSELINYRGFLSELSYSQLISVYLNKFLSSLPQESAADTPALHPIDQLLFIKELESISDLPLELIFRFSDITDEQLNNLSNLLTNVRSLQISFCYSISSIPPNWLETLENINIDSSNINKINSPIPKLKIFIFKNVTDLIDLSGLDNSPALEKLNLQRTSINTLPIACNNLEYLDVSYCSSLTDLSPLNSCKKLTTLIVSKSAITHLPSGCDSLVKVKIRKCKKLTDLSPLDGCKKLIKLQASGSSIINLPTGCDNLEYIDVSYCSNLTDTSFLNCCKKLTKLLAYKSAITHLPTGCFSLTNIDVYGTRITDEYLSEYNKYLSENEPK